MFKRSSGMARWRSPPDSRRSHIGNELGNCLGLNGRIDRHDPCLACNANDWSDVADKIKSELVVKRGIERGRAVHEEERIAVRRCSDDRLGGDVGVSAGPVLNDKWLAKSLR